MSKGGPISLGQSMKPGIYATKKAIALITIAMVRMIRSSLVIPANMTQDGSISLEYTVGKMMLSSITVTL